MEKIFYLIVLVLFLASCSDKDSSKLFNRLTSAQTGVDFANIVQETEDWNSIQYLYFYNGGGVAVGDINNDGLPDLAFTANQLPNKLYVNKGDLDFEDVTVVAGFVGNEGEKAWKTGISMVDVNADGWLDIYVCQVGDYKKIKGKNELYINQKDGTFLEQAAVYGLDFKGFSQQAAWLDYDQDGDIDVFLLNHSVHSPESFEKAEKRQERDPMAGDILFRNDKGNFFDVSEEAGIYGGAMGFGLGVAVSDLNQDGYPDIYVSNDFHENDYLYLNQKNGTFREIIKEATTQNSTFAMGCDIADLNNDHLPDILTLDMRPEQEELLKKSGGIDHFNLHQFKLDYGYHHQFPRNMLQINQGVLDSLPRFLEVANIAKKDTTSSKIAELQATDWSWSPLIADFNNDGFNDIFIGNGIPKRPNDLDYLKFVSAQETKRSATDLQIIAKMPAGKVANYAFENFTISGNYWSSEYPFLKDVSEEWGLNHVGCSNGAVYSDLDNDGDLDLIVNNLNEEAHLYQNQLMEQDEKHELRYLKLKINGPEKNPFGIGAVVSLKNRHFKELYPIRGWQSSIDYVLHFGIIWNKVDVQIKLNGKQLELKDVATNQTITVDFQDFKPITKKANPIRKFKFNDISEESGLHFRHKENKFNDFNVQPLMPWKISREGPALAAGDVNGDGVTDVFLGGAKAQASALFLQKEKHQFVQKENNLFEKDKMSEAVAAQFFDADNDGDLDLYVVNGGGEARSFSNLLLDQLYFNDGQGNFTERKEALPQLKLNGSCVVAADFNEDGAVDLFVGTHSVPLNYGAVPESVVLLNDGKGNFRKDEDFAQKYGKIGMVKDAVYWEQFEELIVVGEWMEPMFFEVNKGTLKKLSDSIYSGDSLATPLTGFWNAVEIFDFSEEGGGRGLLLGNLGENTALRTPVEMYVKDFDGNNQTEPILTYEQKGKKYLLSPKDDMTNQLPFLRKKFLDYQSFAEANFAEILPEKMTSEAIDKKVNTLKSTVLTRTKAEEYELKWIPRATRFAPINGFTIADEKIFSVGNFTGNNPVIGRNASSFGHVWGLDDNFTNDNRGDFFVPEDARDIITLEKEKLVIVAVNDGSVKVYHYEPYRKKVENDPPPEVQ